MTLSLESRTRDNPLGVVDLRPRKRDAAIIAMLEHCRAAERVREPDALLDLLLAREALGASVLPGGAALPHARSILVEHACVVVGRSLRGIVWPGAADAVTLVVLALTPGAEPVSQHERFIGALAHGLRQARTRQRILVAEGPDAVRLAVPEAFA